MAFGEHTARVLVHYGTKGMKWGVRKADTSPQDATLKKNVPGRRIKAQGGKYQPASEDAIKAVKAHQVARKSTTDALSNKELQALVQRMQLEQQFNQLNMNSPRASAGRRFINDYLQNGGKETTLGNITTLATAGAEKAAILLPGSRAAQAGIGIGAAIASAYVNKYSKKK